MEGGGGVGDVGNRIEEGVGGPESRFVEVEDLEDVFM